MIKIENVVLPSPEQMMFIVEAARGLHDNKKYMDSAIVLDTDKELDQRYKVKEKFKWGRNDQDCMSVSACLPGYDTYLAMMCVYVKITAPLYWWREFDKDRSGIVSVLQDFSEKFYTRGILLDDFSTENMTSAEKEELQEFIVQLMIRFNQLTDSYDKNLDFMDYGWREIYTALPNTYNQTRYIMLDYKVLSRLYNKKEKYHLEEWKKLCEWIENLPYKELIFIRKGDEEHG